MRILILDIDYTLNMDDPKPRVKIAMEMGHKKYSKAVWNLFREPAEDMDVIPHPIPYKHYEEFIRNYDKVVIITSRLEDWKKATRKWLKKWGFSYDYLYMRPSGDYESDSAPLKRKVIAKLKDKYPDATFVAIDDNEGNIRYYKEEEGFKTFAAPEEWSKALTYHRRINTKLEKEKLEKKTKLKMVK